MDIIGIANPTASVTVNSNTADRQGEYFHNELGVSNTSAPAYPTVTVTSNYGGGATASGEIYVPKTPVVRTYDLDGNLTQDGRWSYTWDGENRLIEMKTISGVPLAAERRLEFEYDYQGRRIRKKVYDRATGGTLLSDIKFVYDGWNVIAELNGNDTLLQTYVWGLDLSGSYSGAGGVGGLLKIEDHGAGGEGHYVAYDGNGNVVALVSESTGALTARYEYGPFGEQVRATGPMALENPFQFSTKAVDLESGFYYYGMRYYNPTTGSWISRDPIGEQGGLNLYGFVGNNPLGAIDYLGLDTYLLLVGDDWKSPPVPFMEAALTEKREIEKSECFCDPKDKVVIERVSSADDIQRLLQENEDIVQIHIYGHGGPGILYVGAASGVGNITRDGGVFVDRGEAFDSTSVADLYNGNIKNSTADSGCPELGIWINSCHSSNSFKNLGYNLAGVFGEHFGLPAHGHLTSCLFPQDPYNPSDYHPMPSWLFHGRDFLGRLGRSGHPGQPGPY